MFGEWCQHNFGIGGKLAISPYLFNHHYGSYIPKIVAPTSQSAKVVQSRLCLSPLSATQMPRARFLLLHDTSCDNALPGAYTKGTDAKRTKLCMGQIRSVMVETNNKIQSVIG